VVCKCTKKIFGFFFVPQNFVKEENKMQAPKYTPAPEQVIPNKQFTFVEFPAIVKNDDKAIAMLGGIQAINSVALGKEKLLPLKFRPEDPHSHATYGDKVQSPHLLVKVRRNKKTNEGMCTLFTKSTQYN
jgi:hypothetical protein